MDQTYGLAALVLITIIGFYKTISALEHIAFALQSVNLHLDAMKKGSNSANEQMIKLLESQNRDLVPTAERQ